MLTCHDKVVGIGNLGGFLHLLARGVLHTEGDVVEERVVKENRLLVHVAHEPTQVGDTIVADIYAIDGNRALIHVVEAWQQVGDGGLARATLAN